jgi:hypothetical protein
LQQGLLQLAPQEFAFLEQQAFMQPALQEDFRVDLEHPFLVQLALSLQQAFLELPEQFALPFEQEDLLLHDLPLFPKLGTSRMSEWSE